MDFERYKAWIKRKVKQSTMQDLYSNLAITRSNLPVFKEMKSSEGIRMMKITEKEILAELKRREGLIDKIC